jgi:hypothetical protein
MDEVEWLKQLESSSPGERGMAALRLKDSFSDEVGDRLVHLLLSEQHKQIFWIISDSVIPKWVVKLERELAGRDEWPFDPFRTAWIVRRVRGMRLPSLERHLEQFLMSDDWTLKLAAVNYCHDKQHHVQAAREVCLLFLEQDPEAPGNISHFASAMGDSSQLAPAMGVHDYAHLVRRIRRFARDFGP